MIIPWLFKQITISYFLHKNDVHVNIHNMPLHRRSRMLSLISSYCSAFNPSKFFCFVQVAGSTRSHYLTTLRSQIRIGYYQHVNHSLILQCGKLLSVSLCFSLSSRVVQVSLRKWVGFSLVAESVKAYYMHHV